MGSKVLNCKNDFPIFKNQSIAYLDTASTSQKPQNVINAVSHFYQNYNANVHRGLYPWAEKATSDYESARHKIADYISAQNDELIFTKGTTESINFIASAWGRKNITKNNSIVITEMEHHSNIVPWQIMGKKFNLKIRYLPINQIGELDLNESEDFFTKKTKIVSIAHVSNVLGTINPIKKLAAMAHNVGAIFIADGAQGAPHTKVDVQEFDCDFYVFSGHKMLGPTGVGILWGKTKLLEGMDPFMGGGEMIEDVSFEESTWNNIPYKFEAGTPNIAQAIGLGAAIDYLNNVGIENIQSHEKELTKYALKQVSQIKNIKIHGTSNNKSGVISFNIKNIHPQDLTQFLDQDNIAIRVGQHCAQPLLSILNETSTARISFYIYNSHEDIDKFCDSINKTLTYF